MEKISNIKYDMTFEEIKEILEMQEQKEYMRGRLYVIDKITQDSLSANAKILYAYIGLIFLLFAIPMSLTAGIYLIVTSNSFFSMPALVAYPIIFVGIFGGISFF